MVGGSKAVVDRVLAAANAHDTDAAAACLSEHFAWEVVMRYAYELSQVKDLGESLTAVMTEESELYRLLRMKPQRVRLRFEVRGDLS